MKRLCFVFLVFLIVSLAFPFMPQVQANPDTFGRTDESGTSSAWRNTDKIYMTRQIFSGGSGCTLQSLYWYGYPDDGDAKIKLALYDFQGEYNAKILVAQTGNISISGSTGQWYHAEVSADLVNGTEYGLSCVSDETINGYFAAGTDFNNHQTWYSGAGKDFAFPDSLPTTGGGFEDREFCIYAYYTTGAAEEWNNVEQWKLNLHTLNWYASEIWFLQIRNPIWNLAENWLFNLRNQTWFFIEDWKLGIGTLTWSTVETWFLTVRNSIWNLAEYWLLNVKNYSWFHVETWLINIGSGIWNFVEDWIINIRNMTWLHAETWLLNLGAQGWHIAEQWLLTLSTNTWHIIEYWLFTLGPGFWNYVEAWLLSVQMPLSTVEQILAIACVGLIIGVATLAIVLSKKE